MTPLKNADYWRGRALILEGAAHKQGLDYVTDLDREFKAASKRIQTEIEAWYARFAANNQITLAEAKRWLTGRDLEEFRWTVQEYIKAGESLNPAFLKQLENASARVHISRLEALQLQIQQQMEVLYGNQVDGLDKTLRTLYREGYYHTAFEIQRGFNLGWDLQGLNEKQIAAVLNRPWSTDGQTFRDRCWKNKAELVNVVQTGLIQGFIRGDGPDKATKLITERFRVSSNKAARLVMTESAYFAAQSQHDCYKDLDVGEFEVVETLDGHTCDICQGLDGAVFPMSDYEPGVTVPPFHPWCRGCTAPHFPDNYGERIARGADGKTYFVPADMKYPEWKTAFVDGGSKEDLTATAVNGTLDLVEQAVGAKKGVSLDIQNAVAGANPNYTPKSQYSVNCQRCVQSYELRRRGYDVIARPALKKQDPIRWGAECFIPQGSDARNAFTLGQSEAAVKKVLAKSPDGSRFAIYVKWKRSYGRGAHVFIAEKEHGVIRYLDPQVGSLDASDYFSRGSKKYFGYFRLDDKKLTTDPNILSATVEVK